MEFLDTNQIKVDPPKRPKKMTATRFATVLGLNDWSTPFSAWCEITRTYEEPFEDSIYTVAGKIIEPKICEYLRTHYFMDIKSPTDIYGEDYFKKTWGDFFPDRAVFGGMWDFLGDDFVVEVKTTKRVEDWIDKKGNPSPPIYYRLQAALYAYLLGFDDVVMTGTFLEESDYPIETKEGFNTEKTEKFEPSPENTIIYEFKVSEEFPDFEERYINTALAFWENYVAVGISPVFSEKNDADILKELRKEVIPLTEKEISKLITEADRIQAQVDKTEARIAEKKARLKEIDAQVKKYMTDQFKPGFKKTEIAGRVYTWTLTKSSRSSLDSTGLKKDLPEVYEKYSKSTDVYSLKKTLIEVEEGK